MHIIRTVDRGPVTMATECNYYWAAGAWMGQDVGAHAVDRIDQVRLQNLTSRAVCDHTTAAHHDDVVAVGGGEV